MHLNDLPQHIHEAATVKRVFGEPYETDGVTVIPVARLRSAGGGGGDFDGDKHEGGLGLALQVAPVGVYVVKDGAVSFVPAVDHVALAGRAAAVLVTGLLAWRSVARARRRRQAR